MAQILAWKRTQITFLKINLESQSLTGSSYFVGNGRLLLFKQLCFFFVDMQIKTLSEFNLIRPRCILIDKSLSNIIIRYSATPYYLPLVSNLQLTLYITTLSYHHVSSPFQLGVLGQDNEAFTAPEAAAAEKKRVSGCHPYLRCVIE